MPIASAFRSALLVFGVALSAFISPALLAQSSTAADGFNPNVDGNVYAIARQPDGKLILAGSFSHVQPNGATQPTGRINLARVLPDGRNDDSFQPGVLDGQVNAIALQSDGKIIIGGTFTTIGGTPRVRLARLNADGSLDSTFSPTFDGSLTSDVMAIALQADGNIVVGGGFTKVNGEEHNRLARIKADGSLDTDFKPNASGMVLSLAVQSDQQILVGGGFTTLSGTARKRIARLKSDGAVDADFDPSANNAVSAIEVLPDGRILIGGSFTTLQPNGATDAVTTGVSRLAKLNADGTISSGFSGSLDGAVAVIKSQSDGRILIGGSFASVGSSARPYLARLYPSGSLDLTFAPFPNFTVNALAIQPNGSVVLGGLFITLRGTGQNSVVRNHVARVSPTGALDTDFRPDVNGRLRSLMVQADGKIIAGGSFTSVGGETRSGLVRLTPTGQVDTSFKVVVNGGVVSAVQQSNEKLIIAGAFTVVNGVSRRYVARLNLDGSLDADYNPSPNGQVNALLLQSDGALLMGGSFSALNPASTTEAVARNYLARIKTDGTLDTAYTAQASDIVWGLAGQTDGKVIVVGAFTSVLPTGATTTTTRYGVARLETDGKLDTVFNPNVNGTVYAVAVQPADGKVILGGNFLQLAPNAATTVTSRNRIARVNADGTLDAAFDPNIDNVVTAIALQSNGMIVVAGGFSSVKPAGGPTDGYSRNYVARLNADGTLDDTFNLYLDVTPGNQVVALAITSDQKILIGGAFSRVGVNGLARNRIARIKPDGSPDDAFNADEAAGGGAPISAVTLQYDGRILAAGTFETINGTGSSNLARFNADGIPDVNFVPSLNGPVYSIAEAPIKGTAVATQQSGFAWLENNGQLRSSFVIGSAVTSMTAVTAAAVQSVGGVNKVLLAGTFTVTDSTGTSVAPTLVRFNPDGSVDPTFALKTTGTINVIKLLSDGKILIGGTFTTVDSATHNNIARLDANGNLDTSFSIAADAGVYTIGFQSDGKMVIGGNFASVASSGSTTYTTSNYLARFNTDLTVDTAFNPKPNASVQALVVQSDGKIVVGGGFTTLQPNSATTTTARTYIARLNTDGTLDDTIDLKANSGVATLVVQSDNKILVGGYFTSIGGEARHFLARLNADLTLDAGFNPNPNSSVLTLALQSDGKILVGGAFTAFQPNSSNYDPALATPRNRAARLMADGTVDPSFNPNFDSTVGLVISYPDGAGDSVIATGSFSAIQPTGSLLVGGSYSAINGVTVHNLALIGGDGSVSSTFVPNPNGAVYAIVQLVDGGTVFGGAFTTVGPGNPGTTRNRIARYKSTGELDAAFNPNADGDVYAIVLQSDGKYVVGGAFNNIGGAARPNLARLNSDGTIDSSFNPGATGAVHTVVLQADGRILYTRAAADGSNSLLRLNADGSADGSFNPANDGRVNSVAVQADGKITVGGSFTTIAGTSRSYLARLNPDGTIDNSVTSVPSGEVTALALQRDGKIVLGGLFNTVDGLPRFGLARVATSAVATDSFSTNSERNAIVWTRGGAAPGLSAVVFETSPDSYTWTNVGTATRDSGTNNWRLGNLSFAAETVYIRASGIMPVSPNGSSGLIESQGYLAAAQASAPVISSATAVSAAAGSGFLYAISATGSPTSYSATGLPAGLTVNTSTGVISGTPTQEGMFTIVITATNAVGSSSKNLILSVGPAGSTTNEGRVINLSVNAQVSTANPVIIAGFVIQGTTPQNVLLRAVGPGLADLATGVLAQPNLKLFKGKATIGENSNWGGSDELVQAFVRLGAFPLAAGSADAAMLVTLDPGPYTMHISDLGTAGGTVLAEVYDAQSNPPPAGSPHLINISARGVVSSSQLVTGGFVITGSTAKHILIRGVGPGLTAQGVTSVLANPKLTLNQIVSGTASVIARNDNWETPDTVSGTYPAASAAEIAGAANLTGAFALTSGSLDSAILITLSPGVYTAQVGASDAGTGGALVEVYEVP